MRRQSCIPILAVVLGVTGGLPLAAQTLEQRIREVQAFLEQDPESAFDWLDLGILWMEKENFLEAERAFREAHGICRDSPTAINNLAVALAARTDYDAALRELSKIADDPTAIDNAEAIGILQEFWASGLRVPDTDTVDLTLMTRVDDCIRPPAETEEVPDEGGAELSRSEAPAAAQAAPTIAAGQVQSPVEVVADWAAAWRAQDVDAYLAHYSRRFVPPGGATFAEWRGQRAARLKAPEFIELEIESPRNRQLGPGEVEIRFRQSYRSDTFQDIVQKALTMELEEDGWKIVSERAE